MRLLSRAQVVPRARLHRPSLAASAQPASVANPAGYQRLSQAWQEDALYLYDRVGECAYPANSFANVFGKIRFYPAIRTETGEVEEVESGPLVDLFARIKDQSGGTSELQESYGRLQFLIGDGYLVVSSHDGEEVWEFLSPLELRLKPANRSKPQEYLRIRAPGLPLEDLVQAPDEDFTELGGDEVNVWRLYRRHPAYSQWADSSIRSVIGLYQLLVQLTDAAAAEALSRIATRGIFYVPDELQFGDPTDASVSEDPAQDPFFQEWEEIVMKPIREPGTAAAAAAAAFRGPALVPGAQSAVPMKDCMGHIPAGPAEGYKEAEMWDKTIRRISLGTLLPPEFITGSGELNHWSGWLVDEQAFRMHFTPAAGRYASDLTSAYLRPQAIAEGIPDAENVMIGYDPEEAIAHPDEFKTALEMHKALAVSDAYLRDKGGATDNDAPGEEELDRRISIMLKDISGALGEEPEQEGETAPQDGGTGDDTDHEPPEDMAEPSANGNARPARVAAMISGAAELAVERTRELAGSRLKSRAKGCQECQEKIAAHPNGLIAAALGPLTVGDVIQGHTREASLVVGGAQAFRDTIAKWGVPPEWADELGQQIENHALRTLYEEKPPPMPTGFQALIARAVT